METAEELLRSKGYAAFSYADLSKSVGIRNASIHHHFPTKENLGIAVVEDYIRRVEVCLALIDTESKTTREHLRRFSDLFTIGVNSGLLPLCGALAAEMAALPESMRQLAQKFLELQRRWLMRVLGEGLQRGEVPPNTDIEACAHNILCQMEGSSFVNLALGRSKNFDPTILFRIAGMCT